MSNGKDLLFSHIWKPYRFFISDDDLGLSVNHLTSLTCQQLFRLLPSLPETFIKFSPKQSWKFLYSFTNFQHEKPCRQPETRQLYVWLQTLIKTFCHFNARTEVDLELSSIYEFQKVIFYAFLLAWKNKKTVSLN